MLKLKNFFLLIMSSQLYSSTRVNHEHCERKQPLLNKIVRTGLQGFIVSHCFSFFQNNKSSFTFESLKKFKLMDDAKKFTSITQALQKHKFMDVNKTLLVPTIVSLTIANGLLFVANPLLKKFI